MRNRRPKRQIIANQRDRIRRCIPRQAIHRQLLRIEHVVREHCGLVVRVSVGVEEGCRHPPEVTSVEDVVVVAESEDEVADAHADWRCGVDFSVAGRWEGRCDDVLKELTSV